MCLQMYLKKCFTDGYPKPPMTVMTDIGRSTLTCKDLEGKVIGY